MIQSKLPEVLEMAKKVKLEEGEAFPGIMLYPNPETDQLYLSMVAYDAKGQITRHIFVINVLEFLQNKGLEGLNELFQNPDNHE